MQTPLTRPCLKLIFQHLSPINYNNAATRAAFTLAYAGFLRVRKFTYKESNRELGLAFCKWFLTKRSMRIRARGSFMELTIPSSKTDPFRRGIKLTITASNDSACPVHPIQQILDLNTYWCQHSPLFCIGHGSQQAFTREYVV